MWDEGICTEDHYSSIFNHWQSGSKHGRDPACAHMCFLMWEMLLAQLAIFLTLHVHGRNLEWRHNCSVTWPQDLCHSLLAALRTTRKASSVYPRPGSSPPRPLTEFSLIKLLYGLQSPQLKLTVFASKIPNNVAYILGVLSIWMALCT